MSILDYIIKELGQYAEIIRVNEYKHHKTLYLKSSLEFYDTIEKGIRDILSKYKDNSEIITLSIETGEFVDLGLKTIEVDKGIVWEIYLYEECIHVTIRLLHMCQEKVEWVALYIDYNPESAWWSEEERGYR
jgi:hypothetical protein